MQTEQPAIVPESEADETLADEPATTTATSGERALKAPVNISAAQWTQAAQDPLVLRVTEVVEGTLFDVRPMDDQDDVNPSIED